MDKFNIKQVSVEEIYAIRQQVLRPEKPIETCFFDQDKHPDSFHLGAFLNEQLIGVASILKDYSQDFKGSNQYRLRGMAVLPAFRKKQLGATLLQKAEKDCFQKKADLLWFNAREKVVPFYQKYDFQKKGVLFSIPSVGPHRLMFKKFKYE